MTLWLGIDVSKATLDIADSQDGVGWQVPNTPDGWQALTARYAATPPTGVDRGDAGRRLPDERCGHVLHPSSYIRIEGGKVRHLGGFWRRKSLLPWAS